MNLQSFWLPVYLHFFLSSYFVPSFCLVSSVNFNFPLGLNLYSSYFSLNENFFCIKLSFLSVSFFVLVFDSFSVKKNFTYFLLHIVNITPLSFCLSFYYWPLLAPLYLFCLFFTGVSWLSLCLCWSWLHCDMSRHIFLVILLGSHWLNIRFVIFQ